MRHTTESEKQMTIGRISVLENGEQLDFHGVVVVRFDDDWIVQWDGGSKAVATPQRAFHVAAHWANH